MTKEPLPKFANLNMCRTMEIEVPAYQLFMLLKGRTFNEIQECWEEYSKIVKQAGNIQFDNCVSLLLTNVHGDSFVVSFIDGFTMWDNKGSTFLYSTGNKTKTLTNEIIASIERIMNDYSHGYVPCSKCKTMLKQNEIAGRYFAGVFCKECWEAPGPNDTASVKEMATRETYN